MIAPAPNKPVNEVLVTFAAPIDHSSFTRSLLTLSRDGGRNLINRRVKIVAVRGTPATYRIEGLRSLTKRDGDYSLTINVGGLTGLSGSGSSSISWTLDKKVPRTKLKPRTVHEPNSIVRAPAPVRHHLALEDVSHDFADTAAKTPVTIGASKDLPHRAVSVKRAALRTVQPVTKQSSGLLEHRREPVIVSTTSKHTRIGTPAGPLALAARR